MDVIKDDLGQTGWKLYIKTPELDTSVSAYKDSGQRIHNIARDTLR